MSLDPITLSVIQAGLQQVCDEMDLSFSRAGFRPTGFAHSAQSLHADITGVAGSRHRLDETARWLDAPAP